LLLQTPNCGGFSSASFPNALTKARVSLAGDSETQSRLLAGLELTRSDPCVDGRGNLLLAG
jgi:hypothetical protein